MSEEEQWQSVEDLLDDYSVHEYPSLLAKIKEGILDRVEEKKTRDQVEAEVADE